MFITITPAAALKFPVSLVIGMAVGYASVKILRIAGYLAGALLLLGAVTSALGVGPVDLHDLVPRAAG